MIVTSKNLYVRYLHKVFSLAVLLTIFLYSNSMCIKAQSCLKKSQGDANCDGTVDLLDFEEFRQEFLADRDGSLNITTAKANFNNDSNVDLLDFEIFRVGYISRQNVSPTPTAIITNTPTKTPTSSPTIQPTTTYPPVSGKCARPYSNDSPWNTPIPTNTAYEAQSAGYVDRIGSTLSANVSSYTYPFYYVNNSTPEQSVTISGIYTNVTTPTSLSKTSGTFKIRMPASAVSASGTDANIIVWNPDSGDEYGLWQAHKNSNGSWSAVNGYHYNTNWSAVPPKGFMSRGAGLPYFAGLIRPCEIAQGHIDHALAFGYSGVGAPPVYPATKSDGSGVYPNLPEGARIQLDPSLTEADLKAGGCSGTCLIIAKAIQTYGMYVIDYSGSSKIYAEYQTTANWGSNGVPSWSSSIASAVPMKKMKIVKFPQ